MFVYSITYLIEANIEEDWLQWLELICVPQFKNSGLFSGEPQIQQLIEPASQEGTHTYNLQFLARSQDQIETFQQMVAPTLEGNLSKKFGERAIFFQTILRRI